MATDGPIPIIFDEEKVVTLRTAKTNRRSIVREMIAKKKDIKTIKSQVQEFETSRKDVIEQIAGIDFADCYGEIVGSKEDILRDRQKLTEARVDLSAIIAKLEVSIEVTKKEISALRRKLERLNIEINELSKLKRRAEGKTPLARIRALVPRSK